VTCEARQGPFLVSDDRARLDLGVIHGFLRTAYWSMDVPADVVKRAIEGSLCFGLFEHDRQVGFARAITDRATYAYLADVFVLPSHRGRGLARWLMECVMAHPDLQPRVKELASRYRADNLELAHCLDPSDKALAAAWSKAAAPRRSLCAESK